MLHKANKKSFCFNKIINEKTFKIIKKKIVQKLELVKNAKHNKKFKLR